MEPFHPLTPSFPPMNAAGLRELVQRFFGRTDNPGYSTEVTSAASDLSEVEIQIVFLAGRRYCCAEPICHFNASRFRAMANDSNVTLHPNLMIRIHGVIEEGAILESNEKLGLPVRSRGYEYRIEIRIR